jgi:hypothetical protein
MKPSPRESRRGDSLLCSLLLVPTLLIFVLLTWDGAPFCCDASAYMSMVDGHRAEGLFYHHTTLGYRAYLFPYFYSLIPFAGSEVVFGDIRGYTVAAISVFLAVEFAVLMRTRESELFWPLYVGFFVNPLLLVYIPYPLAESFLLIAFNGLTSWLLVLDYRRGGWRFAAVLGLFAGVMYMTRPSNLVLAIPIGLLLVGHLRARVTASERLGSAAAFSLLAALVIAPQSAAMLRYFDTPVPYPNSAALETQLVYGEAYAKYATNVSGRMNTEPPLAYWNPLNCESDSSSNARNGRLFACLVQSEARRDGPGAIAFTGLIHIYNALNYDVLKPYITQVSVPLFSIIQLLSMTVVFLGGYGALRKLALREAELRDWFLLGIAGVSLAVTTITAVETRFGVLATAVFSLFAAELLIRGRPAAREWLPLGFGLVLFLLTSSLLSVYVLALSGGASP